MERNVTVIPAGVRSRSGSDLIVGKKIRVAAYCRVSTEHEEQQSSFENQIAYYTRYIQQNPAYQMVEIYADEGITGTNTKKREGFNRMIADCEAGKIDLVVTKSISRFARNTQDCLNYSRKLRGLGIGILFEKENINTMEAGGELLFTVLSSLAQEESRNISENCKWGIRHNYRQGIVHLNTTILLGYDKDKEGNIIVDPDQAAIVKRIFREFEEGWTPAEIAKRLNKEKIKGVHGESAWSACTIRTMLANEKYKGDARLQKTVTVDYLTKKRVKNEGQVEQYYVTDSHEAIIPKEEWEAVQLEMSRRRSYCEEVGLKNYGKVSNDSAFTSKIVCGRCGTTYTKKSWSSRNVFLWCCRHRWKGNESTCQGDIVKDAALQKAMVIAWNSVVKDRDKLLATWEDMKEAGNLLQKMRAKQMIELTDQGPLTCEVPELTRMVLERIIVHSKTQFTVRFLDGTEKEVCVIE